MRIGLVVVAVALALGGCKTAAERQQIQAAEDGAACAKIGALPGTDRDFQCKLALETQRRNESAAYGAAQAGAQEVVAAQARQQYFNRMIYGR